MYHSELLGWLIVLNWIPSKVKSINIQTVSVLKSMKWGKVDIGPNRSELTHSSASLG